MTDKPIALAGEHISHERAFHIALVLEMSELSDRNSPEDDPGAMVADSNEMAGCIERALERADLVLAAPSPSASSVPVGEVYEHQDGNFRIGIHYYVTPPAVGTKLYSAPPANPAPIVLTDEQVKAARTEWFDEKWSECEFKDVDDYFNTRMCAAVCAALLQANGATS